MFGSRTRFTTLAVLTALALGANAHTAVAASSITVTANGDGAVNDSLCTLREAITAANTHASFDGCQFSGSGSPTTIAFDVFGLSVTKIDVTSRLPPITTPVVIDGLTEAGADCTAWPPTLWIQIGNPSHGPYNGLTLEAGSDGSTIRGLVINGFSNNQAPYYNFNAAINIIGSNNNHIECNLIGTDASGTLNMANLRGVDIASASNNVIGSDGTVKAYYARNLISGNTYGQVDTRGNAPSDNLISGNFIGTDVTGTLAMSGQSNTGGINIGASQGAATGNYIGWNGVGNPALMRNIISGFTSSSYPAVSMDVLAQGNHISGNFIGTDVTGSMAIPNFYGVLLGSNSSVYGNFIGNDGTQDVQSARNVISGNSFAGIAINSNNGTHDNSVIDNYIGMNAAGTATLANGHYGISLDYASADTLVARNWFAGQSTAIRFFASSTTGSASFINNANGSNANVPALDSSDNCVLGATGVQVYTQGGTRVDPNKFANNWWGAAGGPNTPGASSTDASIAAAPFLNEPASVCSDIIFRDGFEVP